MPKHLSPTELAAAARVLQGLAHPLRLGILQCLSRREMTVGELQRALGCSQSSMSQQLRLMEDLRLVRMHRQGRCKYCSIRNADLLQVFHCMRKHLGTYFKMED